MIWKAPLFFRDTTNNYFIDQLVDCGRKAEGCTDENIETFKLQHETRLQGISIGTKASVCQSSGR